MAGFVPVPGVGGILSSDEPFQVVGLCLLSMAAQTCWYMLINKNGDELATWHI